MRTKFQDYGSDYVLLEKEGTEPTPKILFLKDNDTVVTYKRYKIPSNTICQIETDSAVTHESRYWILIKCENCLKTSHLTIIKGIKFTQKLLSAFTCPHCDVDGSLKQAFWNGNYYQFFTSRKQESDEAR